MEYFLKFFNHTSHLPDHLVPVANEFMELAYYLRGKVEQGDMNEREGIVAMRKLLECKDAAIRACVFK